MQAAKVQPERILTTGDCPQPMATKDGQTSKPSKPSKPKKNSGSSFPLGRFYEEQVPNLNDLVVCQVSRVGPMGAYVTLLEYDGKGGMMLLGEISQRRTANPTKLVRVGRIEICMTLKVDLDKGYIDLSKRRVDLVDAAAKEEAFAKAKALHSIVAHVAKANDIDIEELCKKVSWPLHKKYKAEAYDVLKRHIITQEINVWSELDFRQPGQDLAHKAAKLQADIEAHLRRRLMSQMIKLRAHFELSCSEYEGIDAVRDALLAGSEVRRKDCEVKIHLQAHPLFVITCSCLDKDAGLDAINASMLLMKESIESKGGEFMKKSSTAVVGPGMGLGFGMEDFNDGDCSDRGSDSCEDMQDETMGVVNEKELAAMMANTLDLKAGEDDDDDDD